MNKYYISCGSQNKNKQTWKILRDGNARPPYLSPEKPVNWERKTTRLHIPPAYLTSIQSTPWEMPGWMTHKLETRLPGEISATSNMQVIPL